MYSKSKWRRGIKVSFVHFFVVFSFVVFICSFLVAFLFIHFNIFAVKGHDDIEMWPLSSTKAIGLEFEWAFSTNVNRKGRDARFGSR